MNSHIRFSNILSKALDSLGYSYSAIKKRIDFYTTLLNVIGTDFNVFMVGSKREGVSLPLESDQDLMYVLNNFVCFDGVSIHPNFTFKLIREDIPPGYTKLKLENDSGSIDNSDPDFVTEIHEHVGRDHYLSSDKLFEQLIPHMNVTETDLFKIYFKCREGPSCPMEITTPIAGIGIKSDLVCALPCICSDYLSAWCSRERYHGFPSEQTIHEISQMEAYVVPVGYKGCDEQRLQWRICYTLTEIKLIQSFNSTQFQLYVSLKKIAKTVLKPICSEITSYVIKNVVLWIIEITPQEQFKTDLLSRLIVKSLLFLKIVINENYIPNYMIPVRNLLAGKMLPSTKNILMKALCSLNDKGGSVMFECPEVSKEVVILHKNPGLYFTRKSDRESYIEYHLKFQLNVEKLFTQKFETLHELTEDEFTESIVETLPMDLTRKKIYIEMALGTNNPQLLQSHGIAAIKTVLKSQSLKEMFIRIQTENQPNYDDCDSVTTEPTNDELDLQTFVSENDVEQLMFKYMIHLDAYFEEMVPIRRVVEAVISNRDFLSEYYQLIYTSFFRTIIEKPKIVGELFKMMIEKDLMATISDDDFKLMCREYFRFENVEDRQNLFTNPVYHNFFTKMMSGGSV